MSSYIAYDKSGKIKAVSENMVAEINDGWRHIMKHLLECRATIPKKRFGKMVANAIIREGHPMLIRTVMMRGRSASEPRVVKVKEREKRARRPRSR